MARTAEKAEQAEKPRDETAVARQGFDKIKITERGMDFEDARAMYAFARLAVQSGALPRCYHTPEEVCMAISMGRELGIQPVQSIYSITIINQQLTPFGDLTASRIDSSPIILDREEWYEVDGEPLEPGRRPRGIKPGMDVAAVCKLTYKRPGMAEPRVYVSYYHLEEAEESELFPGKDRHGNYAPTATWNRFTARMLMWKARNWGARDIDPNVMKGFGDENETRDAWEDERKRPREIPAEIVGSINLSQVKAEAPTPKNGKERDRAEEEDEAFARFREQAKAAIEEKAGVRLHPEPQDPMPDEARAEVRAEVGLVNEKIRAVGLDPLTAKVIGVRELSAERGNIDVAYPDAGDRIATASLIWERKAGDGKEILHLLPDDPDTKEEAENAVAARRAADAPDPDFEVKPPDYARMTRQELLATIRELGADVGLEGKDLTAYVKEQFPGSAPSQLSVEQLAQLARNLHEQVAPPA